MTPTTSVIIPAFQEEYYIQRCLDALLLQDIFEIEDTLVEIIVVVNGSQDSTAVKARQRVEEARSRGIRLVVLELSEAGKSAALTAGDAIADGGVRVYLDADVICERKLLRLIAAALDTNTALYASGTLTVSPASNWVTRHYSHIWCRLPFVQSGVSGCGFYAVNSAGRARWADFPRICSDDKFVRLLFSPQERLRVSARYYWPLPEGLFNLVRARRRWCEGSAELARTFPDLAAGFRRENRLKPLIKLAISAPLSAIVFVAVFAISTFLAWGVSHDEPIVWRRGR